MSIQMMKRKLLFSTALTPLLNHEKFILGRSTFDQRISDQKLNSNEITKLHQIILTDGLLPPIKLHRTITENSEQLKNLYPKATYKLWCGEELRHIIKHNFDRSIIKSFDMLKPYAFKADLARYCILYLYGGLYMDLGITPKSQWHIPVNYGLSGFHILETDRPNWLRISVCLLWAKPNRLEFQKTIERIANNCKIRFYGSTPSEITGSEQLGISYAETAIVRRHRGELTDQWIGQKKEICFGHEFRKAFLAPRGSIIAVRRPDGGGDWASMPTLGTNNYVEMWHRRNVYTP